MVPLGVYIKTVCALVRFLKAIVLLPFMKPRTSIVSINGIRTVAEAAGVLRELLRYVHIKLLPGFQKGLVTSDSEGPLYIRHIPVTPHKSFEATGR